jgi:hypothetical protein
MYNHFAFDGTWDEQLSHLRMLPALGQHPQQKLAAVRIRRQMPEQPVRKLDLANDFTAIMF